MAAPTPSGRSGGVSGTTDTTSHAITLPAGINVGDLLLVFFTSDGLSASTASSGWFKYNEDDQNGQVTGTLFYKWATGSDTCTVTTSTSQQSSHITYAIPNGGVPSAAISFGASTNSNPPEAFTFQQDDYLVIASRHGDAQVVATAAPSSFSNLQTKTGGSTNGASTNTAELQTAFGDGYDPGAFTSATEDWVCFTVLIPPIINVTQTVLDNFNSTLDTTTKWDDSDKDTGTVAANVSGQLNLSTPAGAPGYVFVNWIPTINMSPGHFYGVKVIQYTSHPTAIPASLETYPIQIYIKNAPAGPTADVIWSNGNVSDELDPTGSDRTSLTDFNPPPVTATYWGVGRYSNGDLMWAYSPDGIHWRRHISTTWPTDWDSSSMGLGIGHGQYDVETNADTAIFEDFSLLVMPGSGATVKVHHGGAWVDTTAVKVRRGGAWVDTTAIKVRRGGAWVNLV